MAQQPLVKRRIPVNFAPRTRQDFLVLAVLNQGFVVCRNGARAANDRKGEYLQVVRVADRSFRQCFRFGIHRVRGDLPEAPCADQLHQELLDGQAATHYQPWIPARTQEPSSHFAFRRKKGVRRIRVNNQTGGESPNNASSSSRKN